MAVAVGTVQLAEELTIQVRGERRNGLPYWRAIASFVIFSFDCALRASHISLDLSHGRQELESNQGRNCETRRT